MKSPIATLMLPVAAFALALPLLEQANGKTGMQDPQPQPPQAQNQPESASQPVQTFEGSITRSEGSYVFKDSTGTTYQLDDQKKAKKYAGQSVRLKGSLDTATNTIHVSTIAPAS